MGECVNTFTKLDSLGTRGALTYFVRAAVRTERGRVEHDLERAGCSAEVGERAKTSQRQTVQPPTSLKRMLMRPGFLVHTWTFRNERQYLGSGVRRKPSEGIPAVLLAWRRWPVL